jgi:hypothetical protein
MENYEIKKEREIEVIEEEKIKLKECYEEYLSEKEKEIHDLNDFIAQLKTKITEL